MASTFRAFAAVVAIAASIASSSADAQTVETHRVEVITAKEVGLFRPTHKADLQRVSRLIEELTNAFRTKHGRNPAGRPWRASPFNAAVSIGETAPRLTSEKILQAIPQSALVQRLYSTRAISGFGRVSRTTGVGPGTGSDECFISKKDTSQ